jgi:hypothetical protein
MTDRSTVLRRNGTIKFVSASWRAGQNVPYYGDHSIVACVRATICRHEITTGTDVAVSFKNLRDTGCLPSVKFWLCRFVQEGLANDFGRPGGRCQSVVLK